MNDNSGHAKRFAHQLPTFLKELDIRTLTHKPIIYLTSFFKVSKQPMPNKVSVEKFITRVLGLANRLALPQRIVEFCGTFPIYMAEEIPTDAINATFYKIQGKNTKWLFTPDNTSDFST